MFRAGDISSARPRRRRRTPLAPLLSIPLSSRRIHAPRLCLQPCTRAAAELYLTTARDGRDLDEHGVGRLLNTAKDGAPSPPWELTLLHHPLLLDLEHQFPPPLSTSSRRSWRCCCSHWKHRSGCPPARSSRCGVAQGAREQGVRPR